MCDCVCPRARRPTALHDPPCPCARLHHTRRHTTPLVTTSACMCPLAPPPRHAQSATLRGRHQHIVQQQTPLPLSEQKRLHMSFPRLPAHRPSAPHSALRLWLAPSTPCSSVCLRSPAHRLHHALLRPHSHVHGVLQRGCHSVLAAPRAPAATRLAACRQRAAEPLFSVLYAAGAV